MERDTFRKHLATLNAKTGFYKIKTSNELLNEPHIIDRIELKKTSVGRRAAIFIFHTGKPPNNQLELTSDEETSIVFLPPSYSEKKKFDCLHDL